MSKPKKKIGMKTMIGQPQALVAEDAVLLEKPRRGKPPGTPKGVRTGGNIAGTRPKKENTQKEFIKQFLDAKRPEFSLAFDDLTPYEQCQVYVNLMKYVVPIAKDEDEAFALSAMGDALLRLLDTTRQ